MWGDLPLLPISRRLSHHPKFLCCIPEYNLHGYMSKPPPVPLVARVSPLRRQVTSSLLLFASC